MTEHVMARAARVLIVGAMVALVPSPATADDVIAAAKRGDLFAVEHYLGKDPDDVAARGEAGYTPLHWAAIRGHWEVFEALLEAGAPVRAVGADGGTPLHWACHHDRPDMVRHLLDRGADVTVANRWGRTPLHVAARRGCDLVALLLLSRGADPDAVTAEGWTPLHVAYKADHPRVIDILLTHGASPDREDDEANVPAEYAFERPSEVAVDPAALDAYVGRYALAPDANVKVWKDRGRLHLVEFAPDEIYPVGPDEFYCRQEPWRIRFGRGDDGAVDRIEIDFLRRTVIGTKLPAYEYVGSKVCGTCHTGEEVGGQYVHWMRSRHALGYWHLATDWASFLAAAREEYADVKTPIEEPRCLKCHVTGAQDPEATYAATFREEEGIGCETCHGPGSEYVDAEIMADRDLFLANGGRVPDANTCRECHQDDRFHFTERLTRIAHPRPGETHASN
jgi:hypothetical protein